MVTPVSVGFIIYEATTNLCLQTPPASAELSLELRPPASVSPAIKPRLNYTQSGLQGCRED